MSETDFLKLKKHDNVETNTEKFDIENYLNGNWDKIDKNVGKVNTDISNINSKNKEQDTNIEQLQENTETSSNKIAELEKELKEAQEDFYQNSIRGQASGEYIHVEDSSNCRAKIGISGNHEQETRSGKNKIEIIKTTTTVNGCTHTIKDGTDTLSGTSTGWANLIIYSFTGNGKTYTLSGSPQSSKNIFISAHDNTQNKDLVTSKNGNAGTFVATSGNSIDIIICVAPNLTLANELFKPQLEEGSTVTEWEQGGVSPSPHDPSKIKSVGSNVNLLENKITSQKIKGIDVEVKDNGKIILNGIATENFALVIGTINKLKNMTFSGMCDGYGYNKMILQIQGKDYNVNVVNSNQITLSDLDTEATVRLYIYKGTSVINAIIEPKIVEGTEVGEYSKYGQGCVKVTKCNKNILNIEDIDETEKSGIKYSVKNGVLRLNGTSTNTISINLLKNIKIKKGKYTHSASYIQLELYISLDNIANTMISLQNGKKMTFELTEDKVYSKYFIWIGKGTVLNNVEIELQLEQGSTESSFEQHEEQSYIMPVQNEMLQEDYFDFDNEEEVHTWGKLVLNGTEKIGISGASTDEILVVVYDINNAIDGFGYSNCFLYSSQVALNKLNVYNNGKNLRVCVDKSKFVDLESFKSKIIELYNEGTPVMIYYKLQTPTRLAFTDEQKAVAKELNNARTYKNVTNITTDSKAILSLDYAKDLETLLTSKESEV